MFSLLRVLTHQKFQVLGLLSNLQSLVVRTGAAVRTTRATYLTLMLTLLPIAAAVTAAFVLAPMLAVTFAT